MPPRKLIPGFDYVTHIPVQYTRAEWRQKLKDGIAKGGRRRVDHNETFLHDAKGLLVFEIYSTIA